MTKRGTKIIATIGPASEDEATLERMIRAGMNLARLNFSHGTAEEQRARAERIRRVAERLGVVVGIIADLQGPKIRIGRFKNGPIQLKPGDRFILDADCPLDAGDSTRVGLTYKELVHDVHPGDRLLLNDGLIVMDVEEVRGSEIRCVVVVGGELSDSKGVNRFGGGLSAKALTEKDRADLAVACEIGVDYIAISFPRDGEDMREARRLVEAHGSDARLIAKIERAEAVDNLEDILEASDAVMVARGDLGVEIGDAAVPPVQKRILRLAPHYNCPVIVATQMLESMIYNPMPTRAEVSDVANAVLDGADAVMLSAETASGRYPVEAVEAMDRICIETERQNVWPSRETRDPRRKPYRPDECIAELAVRATWEMPIRAAVALTESGATALYMSRHVGMVPIYALTPHPRTA
ncbi:MAG: pyruvate kinase, partial [Zetaproteobacteria bacterium]